MLSRRTDVGMVEMAPPGADPRTEVLLRFTPGSLPRARWRRDRGVLVAAVVAVGAGERSSVPLLSRLCQFLAAQPDQGPLDPDTLAGLLSDRRIAGYAPAGVPADTASAYRSSLRRIARAIGALPEPVARPGRAASGRAELFWASVVGLGPFTALAAAYASTGPALTAVSWHGIDLLAGCSQLVTGRCGSGDGSGGTGMVAGVLAPAQALRSAVDAQPRWVSPTNANRSSAAAGRLTTAGPAAGRALSRTAALKAARQAHRRAQNPGAGDPVPEVVLPALPALPTDVAAAVAAYTPRGLDVDPALIVDVVRALATAYGPSSPAWVSSQAGHLARYAAWVATRPARVTCGALGAVEVCAEGLLEEYLAGPLASVPDSSRATARAVLRRALRNLTGTTPAKIAYQPVQPPYTPDECAAFVRLARNQPTRPLRRAVSAVVALGLGAGLDGREQRAVTPNDVSEVDLGEGVRALAVRVLGDRARTVIVRADYEDLLREAVTLHRQERRGQGQPLYGQNTKRRNVTSSVTSRTVTATGTGVELSAARLRNTWLVALMCCPVPLSALLGAAGLTSARTLVDLLPHCPTPDPADVARVLHAAQVTS